MKKYLIFFLFPALGILLGASCQTNPQWSGDIGFNVDETFEQTTDKLPVADKESASTQPQVEKEQMKLWKPIPQLNNSYIYYRNSGKSVVIGQVKAKFINKETNQPVPGHAIDCTGCIDSYQIKDKNDNAKFIQFYPESDVNGEVVINITTDQASIAYARTDWYMYETKRPLKPGDEVEIYMNPQPVRETQTLNYPKATYQKNSAGKTQLHLTVRNSAGKGITGRSVIITGPTYNDKRTSPIAPSLSSEGKTVVDLPINGAYRMQIYRGDDLTQAGNFYQFNALTGHNTNVEVILAK